LGTRDLETLARGDVAGDEDVARRLINGDTGRRVIA
jgi:hypothetical protein